MKKNVLLILLSMVLTLNAFTQEYTDLSCDECPTASWIQAPPISIEYAGCIYSAIFESKQCNGINEFRIKSISAPCSSFVAAQFIHKEILKRALHDILMIFPNLNTPAEIKFVNSQCWSASTGVMLPCLNSPCCVTTYTILRETNQVDPSGWAVRILEISPVPDPSNVINCAGSTSNGCISYCNTDYIPRNTLISYSDNQFCPENCYWTIKGNTNTNADNFVGTRHEAPLVLKSNNIEGIRINTLGQVGIWNLDPPDVLTIGPKMNFHVGNSYDFFSSNEYVNGQGIRKRIKNGYAYTIDFQNSGIFGIGNYGNGIKDDILSLYNGNEFKGLTISNVDNKALIGIGTIPNNSSRLLIRGLSIQDANKFAFKIINNDASKTLFSVLDNGFIGIGTDQPQASLSILANGSNGLTNAFRLKNSNNNIIFNIFDNGDINVVGTIKNNNASLPVYFDKAYIGIGTISSPNIKFEVVGDTKINGTTEVTSNLKVQGTIYTTEVLVKDPSEWPDYVFNSSYKLKNLKETSEFINQYGHLPEVPSADEIQKNGVKMVEMQKILLKKIEELTIHLIKMDEQNKLMQEEIIRLKEENILKGY